MDLERMVLERLRPSDDVKSDLKVALEELLVRVENSIEGTGLPLETMLVGSVAKGTFVGIPDIDLFILFPPETERSLLEEVGLKIGREALGGETRYAEHPYTHGSVRGFEVDLVPCYKIDDPVDLKSAVDRTPFHTRYVLGKIEEGQRDQMRMLKQFMKGVGVYGAEARVQGFSGYLTELLVLTFGDFRSVIESAEGWRPGLMMTVEGKRKGSADAVLHFTDPVDSKRNVASALSLDCFSLFVHACREYLKGPDERFFFPNERPVMSLAEVRRGFQARGTVPFVVVLDRPELVDDNLYPQVNRSLQGIRKLLEAYDFRVLDQAYSVGSDVRMAFELENDRLPLTRLHIGPPAWTKNSEDFLAKWRGNDTGEPFLSEGRWQVLMKREVMDPAQLIRERLGEAAMGNGFREVRGVRCASRSKAVAEGNRPVLTRLLDKRENWRV